MPNFTNSELKRMSQEERDKVHAMRKVVGVFHPKTPERMSEDEMEATKMVTRLAVEYYNNNHEVVEIDQPAQILVLLYGGFAKPVVHLNFLAKPKSADSPKHFFAELRIVGDNKYSPTMCCMLGEDAVKGCTFCDDKFNIAHPPGGFRGCRSEMIRKRKAKFLAGSKLPVLSLDLVRKRKANCPGSKLPVLGLDLVEDRCSDLKICN